MYSLIRPEKFNWQFSIVECVIQQFLVSGNLVRSPNGKAIISALFSICLFGFENEFTLKILKALQLV
jgi:hypothetical protein